MENPKKLMVDKVATMRGGSVKLKKSTQKHRYNGYNIVSFKLFNTFHALMNNFIHQPNQVVCTRLVRVPVLLSN